MGLQTARGINDGVKTQLEISWSNVQIEGWREILLVRVLTGNTGYLQKKENQILSDLLLSAMKLSNSGAAFQAAQCEGWVVQDPLHLRAKERHFAHLRIRRA